MHSFAWFLYWLCDSLMLVCIAEVSRQDKVNKSNACAKNHEQKQSERLPIRFKTTHSKI